MSVPASKRATSGMQYVETARRLARNILSYCARIPKRHAQRLSNLLFNHAAEALYCVRAANGIRVTTDETYAQRKSLLLEGLGHIDHVASLLDISYDVEDRPNANVYAELAGQIDKERALIHGVMDKDRRVWRDGRARSG